MTRFKKISKISRYRLEEVVLKLKIKDFSSALNNTIEFDFYVDTIDDVVLKDKLHIVGTAISNGSGKVEVSGKYSTKIEVQCVR